MSNSHVALSLLEQVNMLYNRVSPSIESCASRFRNNFYKVSMRANYVLLAPTTAVSLPLCCCVMHWKCPGVLFQPCNYILLLRLSQKGKRNVAIFPLCNWYLSISIDLVSWPRPGNAHCWGFIKIHPVWFV